MGRLRSMRCHRLADGSTDGEVHIALNEAAIVRGRIAQVMHVIVDVGDSRVATYICDGVVVASPTGSTGGSWSASSRAPTGTPR